MKIIYEPSIFGYCISSIIFKFYYDNNIELELVKSNDPMFINIIKSIKNNEMIFIIDKLDMKYLGMIFIKTKNISIFYDNNFYSLINTIWNNYFPNVKIPTLLSDFFSKKNTKNIKRNTIIKIGLESDLDNFYPNSRAILNLLFEKNKDVEKYFYKRGKEHINMFVYLLKNKHFISFNIKDKKGIIFNCHQPLYDRNTILKISNKYIQTDYIMFIEFNIIENIYKIYYTSDDILEYCLNYIKFKFKNNQVEVFKLD